MSCREVKIILDTCVFVFWCCGEPGYGQLMDIIREEEMKIVLCPELEKEYQRQLDPRYYGAGNQVLRSKKDQLFKEGVLLYSLEGMAKKISIQRKDQHVMNCAFNEENPVSIIITDNTKDFIADCEYRLPIIVDAMSFLDSQTRHDLCGNAGLIWTQIKNVGEKARFN